MKLTDITFLGRTPIDPSYPISLAIVTPLPLWAAMTGVSLQALPPLSHD